MVTNLKIGQKKPKIPQKTALLSLKKRTRTPCFDVFPLICAYIGCSEIHHSSLFLRIFVPKSLVLLAKMRVKSKKRRI